MLSTKLSGFNNSSGNSYDSAKNGGATGRISKIGTRLLRRLRITFRRHVGASEHLEEGRTLPLPLWPALLGSILTLSIALLGITRPSLWSDEAATISGADRSLSGLIDLLSEIDAVHGLYYLFMKLWIELFGISAFSIRLPSAFALAISCFITVKISMRYATLVCSHLVASTGLATGLLFAVLPGLTWSGQEARGFALGTVFALLAWASFERWLGVRSSRFPMMLIMWQTFSIYFTLYTALLVPLYFLRSLTFGRPERFKMILSSVMVTLLAMPLVITAWFQQGQISWISMTPLAMMREMGAKQFFVGYGLNVGLMSDVVRINAVILACITIGLAVLGMVRGPLRQCQFWLLAWVLFPMLSLFVLKLAGHDLYAARYLNFTAPALVVLLAVIITVCIKRRWVSTFLLFTIVALCVPAVIAQHSKINHDSDYRSASDLLQMADTIYFLEPLARGVIIAYPHDNSADEPLLIGTREETDTLWGVIDAGSFDPKALHSGTVAVVYRAEGKERSGYGPTDFARCKFLDGHTDERYEFRLMSC